jgi:hypothetical protein
VSELQHFSTKSLREELILRENAALEKHNELFRRTFPLLFKLRKADPMLCLFFCGGLAFLVSQIALLAGADPAVVNKFVFWGAVAIMFLVLCIATAVKIMQKKIRAKLIGDNPAIADDYRF